MTRARDEARAIAQVRDDLRQWGRQPVALQSPELAQQRAERGIATLTAALARARQQRKQRAQVRMIALIAAGVLCSLLGAKVLFDGPDAPVAQTPPSEAAEVSKGTLPGAAEAHARGRLTLHRDGASQVVDGIATLRAGDVVETTEGSGQVNLQRVTRIELGPATKLAIAVARPNEQTLRLRRGTASFAVDPSRQARVVVETDDARVVVTGTRFSVTADADPDGTWTAVEVTSGSVLVESAQHSVRLGPGNDWSSRGKAPSSDQVVAARGKAPSPSNPDGPDSSSPKEPRGTTASLKEENALLQAALSARRQGSGSRCVALLDQLVTAHPRSPLRQEALVLRFRCLREAGDVARAKRAAARYLADYPHGFAKDEALTLLDH